MASKSMFRPSGETVTAHPSIPVEGEEIIPESRSALHFAQSDCHEIDQVSVFQSAIIFRKEGSDSI